MISFSGQLFSWGARTEIRWFCCVNPWAKVKRNPPAKSFRWRMKLCVRKRTFIYDPTFGRIRHLNMFIVTKYKRKYRRASRFRIPGAGDNGVSTRQLGFDCFLRSSDPAGMFEVVVSHRPGGIGKYSRTLKCIEIAILRSHIDGPIRADNRGRFHPGASLV